MSERYNEVVAEKLDALYLSETWRIVKRRLQIYIDTSERRAISEIKDSNIDNAKFCAQVAHGIRQALEVAERLPSELKKGQLDVDVLLDVIENKLEVKGKQEGGSWLSKILEPIRRTRHSNK